MTDKKKRRHGLTVNVKTAKGRKSSSTNWLRRQLNDTFVDKANSEGYRSRAVYKLTEIDDKYNFLKSANVIVDLGSAPGSWCQVAVERTKGRSKVIGIDLQEIEPIEGVDFLQGDFLDNDVLEIFESMLPSDKVDVVMSDMAASACGHPQTDHIRIMALCEAAVYFAIDWLNEGGFFVSKVLQGGAEKELLTLLKSNFKTVKHIKPEASRKDSAEMFVIAEGFKGKKE